MDELAFARELCRRELQMAVNALDAATAAGDEQAAADVVAAMRVGVAFTAAREYTTAVVASMQAGETTGGQD